MYTWIAMVPFLIFQHPFSAGHFFLKIGASVAQSIKNGRAEVDVQAKNSLHLQNR